MHPPQLDIVSPNHVSDFGAVVTTSESASSGSGGEVATEEQASGPVETAMDDQEESRKPQIAKRPITPSRAEVESHLPLHLEYRSWCPHCVAGKGTSM